MLRPFPYPFRAALAVSSDIDGCTAAQFRAVHDLANRELGLDLADSFWFYQANPHGQGMAYFEAPREDAGPSADAPLIREGLEKGWIDTLHSYGDFSAVGGFRRALAAKALAELKALGTSVRVWTNHSARHNFQNLGRDGLGDLPVRRSADGEEVPVLEYHADLLAEAGVRFIWRGDLLPVVGQGVDRNLPAHYFGKDVDSCLPGRGKALAAALAWRGLAGPGEWLRWQRPDLYDGDNRLLVPGALRDGREVSFFTRYGRFDRARLDDLPRLLSPAVLDRLVARGGAMVAYTHLGKTGAPGSAPAAGIPAPVRAVFEDLARLQQAGTLWVARTSRLLAYAACRDRISWEPAGADLAAKGSWKPEDLAGITVYTDRRLLLDGKPLPTRANPPDETGRRSLTVL